MTMVFGWPEEAVFVEEEYGFRRYLWLPIGSPEQVVAEFVSLQEMGGMMDGGCLPGLWTRIVPAWQVDSRGDTPEEMAEAMMAQLRKEEEDRASGRKPERWFYAVDDHGNLVGKVMLPERHHKCHVHMPDDSYIEFVDGPSAEPLPCSWQNEEDDEWDDVDDEEDDEV